MSAAISECHILIVDDDPDIVITLQDFLEHEGYQVEAVQTGTDALRLTATQRYNAVILDLGLPDRDGLSVLESLQQVDPHLPVIILTAFTNSERTIGSLLQGAFSYLTKPYNRDELRATLRRALGVQALAVKAQQVETALSESEERFRAVIQSASDAIVIADQSGIVTFWNHAASTMFGYTEHEIVGRPLTTLMPLSYRDAHVKGLRRFLDSGEAQVMGRPLELQGLRKTGEVFSLELSLAAWKSGRQTCFSGIMRDISQRKALEEARRLTEERLEYAMAGSNDGFWDARPMPGTPWNSPHTTVWWSPRFKTMLGFEDHEFPNVLESWSTCLHADDVGRVSDALQAHIDHRVPYDVEYRLRNKQGVYRWFRARGQGTWDEAGHLVRMAGSLQCITDRKRAEDALRESEERFRQLAEHIREVFWLTDPEKEQILYISPAYETIWGSSCGRLYASPCSWIDAIHPDDRERVSSAAQTKQVTGEYDEEYRIIRPDGTIRWIRDRAFPIRDESGVVYRLAGLAEDVTDRHTAS
ncbi:hypothetical protein YTPLAS18_05290 [Nitrospira sp.]|nr:hypothetical protein YTPLAS18_05290 [Nitrospira sp.]